MSQITGGSHPLKVFKGVQREKASGDKERSKHEISAPGVYKIKADW